MIKDNEKLLAAISRVVEAIEGFTVDEQKKIILASIAMLGSSFSSSEDKTLSVSDYIFPEDTIKFHPKTKLWMKQNSVSESDLLEVFHFSGESVEIISTDVPGNNNSTRTQNAYLLFGLSKMLESDNSTFDDKSAREFCEKLGCLDQKNHSKIIKNIGNSLVGSKEKGWAITTPGLKLAAQIIKDMAIN